MNHKELLNIAREVLETESESVTNVIKYLDENFSEVAHKISETNKLIVSGVGKSGIIGRKIASTFASIGVPSFFMHPDDAMHGDLGMVQSGDICILLSKSGVTEELVELLPYLKSRGAVIVSITGNKDSYLCNNSDYFINSYVSQEGCPINTVPMASALVTLAIGDALAACVMKLKNVTIEEFAKQHPLGQIGRNITLTVNDIMHANDRIPVVNDDATFMQAIIEITNKSLGCVCIVDNNKHLSGIITDGDVRRVLQTDIDIRLLKANQVMTRKPITIKDGTYLGEALSIMENRERQINVLPVLNEDNKLVGVVRIHDIVKSGI